MTRDEASVNLVNLCIECFQQYSSNAGGEALVASSPETRGPVDSNRLYTEILYQLVSRVCVPIVVNNSLSIVTEIFAVSSGRNDGAFKHTSAKHKTEFVSNIKYIHGVFPYPIETSVSYYVQSASSKSPRDTIHYPVGDQISRTHSKYCLHTLIVVS